MLFEEYIIYASGRGYWKADSKGYSLNPSLAGVYRLSQAQEICEDSSRKEKMYKHMGVWHKRRIREYRKSKMRVIQNAMEGLTSDDLIEMYADIIKERRKRNN